MLFNPKRNNSEVIENFVSENGFRWYEVYSSINSPEKDLYHLRPVFQELYKESRIHCAHYGEDVVIDMIAMADEFMKDTDDYVVSVFYVGFRENGTDHTGFVESRLRDPKMYGTYEENYKSLYKVIINKEDGLHTVAMYELRKD